MTPAEVAASSAGSFQLLYAAHVNWFWYNTFICPQREDKQTKREGGGRAQRERERESACRRLVTRPAHVLVCVFVSGIFSYNIASRLLQKYVNDICKIISK